MRPFYFMMQNAVAGFYAYSIIFLSWQNCKMEDMLINVKNYSFLRENIILILEMLFPFYQGKSCWRNDDNWNWQHNWNCLVFASAHRVVSVVFNLFGVLLIK